MKISQVVELKEKIAEMEVIHAAARELAAVEKAALKEENAILRGKLMSGARAYVA